MAIWLIVLCVSFVFAWPNAVHVVCFSGVAGAVAGFLQFRAIRATATQLVMATTAIQVRRVLRNSAPGKYSIYLLWAFGVSLIAMGLSAGFDNPLVIFLAGYSSFALAREAIALPAVLALSASK